MDRQFGCSYCGSAEARVQEAAGRFCIACPACGLSGPQQDSIEAALATWQRLVGETARSASDALARCEQGLATALAKLERTGASRAAFLSNMSHEVRTPMSAIVGLAELALRRTSDEGVRDYLGKIMQASQSLLDVVTDIIDIAKIEHERLVLRQEDFHPAALLDRLTLVMMPKAAEKGLVLRIFQSHEAATMTLRGDSARLGQVLFNLTENAIKYTREGSVIVRLEVLDGSAERVRLRFEIEDTGPGIAEEDCERIFSAFEEAEDSVSRRYGGTGLGLAICKRLVQMMGGDIGVLSQLGAGSTFWCSVPLLRSASVALPTPPAHSVQVETRLKAIAKGYRILLVEDNPMNQLALRLHLEQVGFVVDSATDGSMAIDMSKRVVYALILMDLQMPYINGIEATRVIRTLEGYAHTPIVAVTANAFEEDRQACLEAGMNEHLTKPVHVQTLYETLLRCLSVPA